MRPCRTRICRRVLPLPEGVVAGDLKGVLNGGYSSSGASRTTTLVPLDVDDIPSEKPAEGDLDSIGRGYWRVVTSGGQTIWRIWKDGDAIKVDSLTDGFENTRFFTSLTIQLTLEKRLEIASASGGGSASVSNDNLPTSGGSTTIAASIRAVVAALFGKQNKLTGTAGQRVGFDRDGNAVAEDVSAAGSGNFIAAYAVRGDPRLGSPGGNPVGLIYRGGVNIVGAQPYLIFPAQASETFVGKFRRASTTAGQGQFSIHYNDDGIDFTQRRLRGLFTLAREGQQFGFYIGSDGVLTNGVGVTAGRNKGMLVLHREGRH